MFIIINIKNIYHHYCQGHWDVHYCQYYTCHPNSKSQIIPNAQIPNVDQFPWSTNKHPEFVRVVGKPCVMLDAYWTGEQVQGYDLHLEFAHLGYTN